MPATFEIDLALTRAEICKVGYTHYFSMAAAKRDLGYKPIVAHDVAVARTAACFGPMVHSRSARAAAALTRLLVFAVVGVVLWRFLSVLLRLITS